MAHDDPLHAAFSPRGVNSLDLKHDVPMSMSLRLQRLRLAETLRAERAAITRAGEDVRRALSDFGKRLQPPLYPTPLGGPLNADQLPTASSRNP